MKTLNARMRTGMKSVCVNKKYNTQTSLVSVYVKIGGNVTNPHARPCYSCSCAVAVRRTTSREIQEIVPHESCVVSGGTVRQEKGRSPKGKHHSHSDLIRQRAGHGKIKIETRLRIPTDNWHRKVPDCVADDTIRKLGSFINRSSEQW